MESGKDRVGVVLDTIDEARRALAKHQDLESEVPSFLVVGMQSVGKSSVLQQVASVSLPRDSEVCTRVPIELSVRRCEPDKSCLRVFGGNERKEYPVGDETKVDEAIKQAQTEILERRDAEFVSDESVKVEKQSLSNPNVTLIDLPGLFFARSKEASEKKLQHRVEKLIMDKIKQKSSLILHVAPMNQDAGTINTWEIVSTSDPDKKRTVVVLTKADRIQTEAEFHKRLRDITKEDTEGAIKYFIVDGRATTLEEEENSLRTVKGWLDGSTLTDRVFLGIEALQAYLQDALLRHTLLFLKPLKARLEKEMETCSERLRVMGQVPPHPNSALIKGLGVFQDSLKDGFSAQLGMIRSLIEAMSKAVVTVEFPPLGRVDIEEVKGAVDGNWLCSSTFDVQSDFPLLRCAFDARKVMENNRKMHNIQFTDKTPVLSEWMPLFSKKVKGILESFVKDVFDILLDDVLTQARACLAKEANGMLRDAEELVLGRKVLQEFEEHRRQAEEFCGNVLTWNELPLLFTANPHYLAEKSRLSDQENQSLKVLREGFRKDIQPYLEAAVAVRGFWKVQAKLIPDALQKETMRIVLNCVKRLPEVLQAAVDEAIPLVKEPGNVARDRVFSLGRQESLQTAIGELSKLDTITLSLTDGPVLSTDSDETREGSEEAEEDSGRS
uniref:Dynamin-type G domain-containing protein n=1 Tax=Chromera velia CCMP2878 TaxID=1169474 RepID=A0A0K6SA03_9ALVE|mmetsp:Transcript_16294/g.33063  ORF Transcript_16294/g.33063 Transcript_16294/m.33063 type:complete len:668 (-) Transcript_16294:982-2985(-)|eukprot:Cvel_32331.t1-p1 / transcript=Cvel_32331.t1 / gene=Cvel_32331 / organism=Chromera_velia_CCMP2878 / gene_product=Interferon-induced GTP-binding protein MxC, putative / transcript_product=Interferon-induced GTP-binding protein MxC, putative / location=Cvel_scaffold5009:1748-4926(+) / protein_length=667 / sequence_SO=supercontig / SO=protein_coding / is_pseudo=false